MFFFFSQVLNLSPWALRPVYEHLILPRWIDAILDDEIKIDSMTLAITALEELYVLMLMRRHIAFIHGKPYLELSLPIKYFCWYYLKKKQFIFRIKVVCALPVKVKSYHMTKLIISWNDVIPRSRSNGAFKWYQVLLLDSPVMGCC